MPEAKLDSEVKIQELRGQVAQARERLLNLEAELFRAERAQKASRESQWFPEGYYTAYYVLSGLVLGIVASWVVLLLNVVGAYLVGEEPLKLLRVYSTILGGERTMASKDAVVLIFAVGVHTLTGAVCGAPIHVIYSRFFMGQKLAARLVTGFILGIVMWLINFYGVLSWLQPLILGEETSYIVRNMPWWVALASHVAFTETMLILQPVAVFSRQNYPMRSGTAGP